MPMIRKTITIPNAMEDWVKAQITNGRYVNDSEYFRDLIRRDQDKRLAEHSLRSMIKEGLDSGTSENSILDIIKSVEGKLQRNGKIPANE